MPKPSSADVDAYIAAADPAVQPILQTLRRTVHQAVPDAQETIGYQMPAFRQKRNFLYVAAFKKHIGIYPPLAGPAELRQELQPYANAKGNLRFPLNQTMPYELIARLAQALAVQYSKVPEVPVNKQ